MAYVNFKSGTLDQITSTSGKPTNLLSISTDITSIFKGDLNITNRVIDASVNNKILAIRKIDASGNYDSDYINFDFASPYTSGNGIFVDNEQGTISLDPNFELFEITSTLPSSNIKKNKIYLVPKQDDSSVANNIYTEYHYLGSGTWEIMGDRQTDIANSLKVAALPTYVSPVPDVSVGDSYDTAFAKLQAKKQDVLISGINIKTIDGSTLLGSGNIDLYNSLYNRLNTVFVHKPDIIYQYQSGYTQIFGQKSNSITNTWDLTDLDLTPYKYIKVFIKGSNDGNTDTYLSSPIICTISLDASIIEGGATYYSGVGVSSYPNNHNRLVLAFCAVDSTKTKFQLIRTVSLYGTDGTDASDKGRYLYRIEGWYDDQESEAGGGSSLAEIDPTVPSYVKNITENDISTWNNKLSSESDPIFTASAAAGITSSDITNWNSKTNNVGTITGINMNGASKGTSGVVDLGTILTEHQSLESYANYANYDSSAKKIYLKHDTSILSEIDATDFIKDGMVSDVSIQSGNLVIEFNTDAGKQPIQLSLSQIFNPNNYYTKNDIDTAGYLTSYTETDPVFSASAAAGITSNDISNWNSKTSNTGTVTGVKMNGTTNNPTNGVVDLGTVITSHQTLKTINGNTITGSGDISVGGLPAVTSSDNGKILQVVNGAWTLVSPVTLYSGSGSPSNSQGNNGDLYVQI